MGLGPDALRGILFARGSGPRSMRPQREVSGRSDMTPRRCLQDRRRAGMWLGPYRRLPGRLGPANSTDPAPRRSGRGEGAVTGQIRPAAAARTRRGSASPTVEARCRAGGSPGLTAMTGVALALGPDAAPTGRARLQAVGGRGKRPPMGPRGAPGAVGPGPHRAPRRRDPRRDRRPPGRGTDLRPVPPPRRPLPRTRRRLRGTGPGRRGDHWRDFRISRSCVSRGTWSVSR